MPETIQIPRAWLEGLFAINKNFGEIDRTSELDYLISIKLFAYIESAKSLLE